MEGICSVISRNYLAQARVLARSFREHHPDLAVKVLVLDPPDGHFDPAREPFDLVTLDELGIPDVRAMCFRYSVLELSTAVKPFLLEYLLRKKGFKRVLYIDPDILITSTLAPLFERLQRRSIILTPHALRPLDETHHPNERTLLQCGAYNLGFVGVSAQALDMLAWWKDRCETHCYSRPEEGLFVDQKWMDLVPSFFPDVEVVTDPGCNVAYWNLHERRVEAGPPPTANGQPLRFFHFSGYDPLVPDRVSKYQNRHSLESIGSAARLFEKYGALLLEQGYADSIQWRYGYNRFDNGVPISPFIRDLYARRLGERRERYGDPFATEGKDSFFNWMRATNPDGLPNVARLLWERRRTEVDVPVFAQTQKADFVEWLQSVGGRVLGIDPVLTGVPRGNRTYAFMRALSKLVQSGSCRVCAARDLMRRMRMRPRVPTFVSGTTPAVAASPDVPRGSYRRLPAGIAKLFRSLLNPCGLHRGVKRLLENAQEVAVRPAKLRPLPPLGVNLVGYFHMTIGLMQAAAQLQRAMEAAGVPNRAITYEPDHGRRIKRQVASHNGQADYPVNVLQINADATPDAASGLGRAFFAGRYSIGAWMWELPEFPREWMESFRYFDEIWGASQFACDAIAQASPIPVVRIPVPISEPRPASLPRSHFGIDERTRLFLFVFNYGSIFERKNPLALVRAFQSAFRPSDDVMLIIKTLGHEHNLAARAQLREAVRNQRIRLIEDAIPREELDALFAHADCYVSLHRSEGYGLTMAEAMRAGKPVIATGWSGNADFMTTTNSFLVRHRVIELDREYFPYKKGSHWAEPDVAHAAELMRHVYDHPDDAARVAAIGKADIERELSCERVGTMIRNRLELIGAKLAREGR